MSYDVYSYGMVSSSILYILYRKFPGSNHYSEIKKAYKMIGGEAANSSIVMSCLGIKVKLDGNWLGNNEGGSSVKNILNEYQVNVERLAVKKDYTGIEEIVFSYKTTRTIFGTYSKLFSSTRQWNIPVKKDILQAKIVCLDPFFGKASQSVSEYAKSGNIPYITVDCKYTDNIFNDSSVAIISDEFRNRVYKRYSKYDLFRKYLKRAKGLVIFTSGGNQILFARKGDKIKRFKPFKITPIDTSGAGDSFRAGIIYGMLKKWSDYDCILFASALASLVCMSFPGVLKCPKYKEVIRFMKLKRYPFPGSDPISY